MIEQKDLKKIEEIAWKSNFEHGLWDMLYGIFLIMTILINYLMFFMYDIIDIASEYVPLISIILVLSIIFAIGFLFRYLYGLVGVPRVGYVKYSLKRKRFLYITIIGLLLYFIFVYIYVIYIFNLIEENLNIKYLIYILPLINGLIIYIIPTCIVAYFLAFKRLYVYGLFAGLVELINELLFDIFDTFYYFRDLLMSIVGLFIISIGFIFFIVFLKKYPKTNKKGEK